MSSNIFQLETRHLQHPEQVTWGWEPKHIPRIFQFKTETQGGMWQCTQRARPLLQMMLCQTVSYHEERV